MNLSIVVPVYSTSLDLVETLLESLDNQETAYIFEVIVVDDGNRIEYAKGLEKICRSHNLVSLYRKDNGGVSEARNYGSLHSCGEYISFVDSDDYVSPYFVQDFLDAAYKYGADYIVGRICGVSTDEVSARAKRFTPGNGTTACLTNALSIFETYLQEGLNDNDGGRYRSVPTCRIVKSSLSSQHPFDSSFCLGEDTIWNADVLSQSSVVVKMDNCYYLYRFNERSSSKRFDSNRLDDSQAFLEALKPRLTLIDSSLEKRFGTLVILWLVSLCKNFFFHPDAPFDGVSMLKQTIKSPFWASSVCLQNAATLPLRYRIITLLLACHQYWLISKLCRR